MITSVSTLLIDCNKQALWQTLTQPELVKQWQYGSDLTTDWKTGCGIRFRSVWGEQVFEQWGKVLQMVPYELIRYSLFFPRPDLEDKPENYFIMTYSLTNADGKIKLDIIKEDNRPGAVMEEESDDENPVLLKLKEIAESL